MAWDSIDEAVILESCLVAAFLLTFWLVFFVMDHSRPLFYFIFVFSTVYTVNLLITDFCWWLDSNRRTSGIEINRSANWATTTIFRWVTADTFLAWTTLLNFLFVSMSWTAKESVQWKLSIEVSLVQIPASIGKLFLSQKRDRTERRIKA